jgi:AcrR family transcriptional regulator
MTQRWSGDDWLVFGAERLREGGAEALALDRLCAAAGRTKGSFYHHFPTMGDFTRRVLTCWRDAALAALETWCEADRGAPRRARLAALSQAVDDRLEANIRALAAREPAARALVAEVDAARESAITRFLAEGWALPALRAQRAGQILYALFVAAQARAPGDVARFTAPLEAQVVRWLGQPRAEAPEEPADQLTLF